MKSLCTCLHRGAMETTGRVNTPSGHSKEPGTLCGASGQDRRGERRTPPVTHALEFDVDPRSLRDVNSLTLSSGSEVSAEWIYLTVKH